jgi:hypothetical protein
MSASMNEEPDLPLFRDDLGALKRDVASLSEHMKGKAERRRSNRKARAEPFVESEIKVAVAARLGKCLSSADNDQCAVVRARSIDRSCRGSQLNAKSLSVPLPGATHVERRSAIISARGAPSGRKTNNQKPSPLPRRPKIANSR